MRGGKHYFATSKSRKRSPTKSEKPKRSVKLKSEGWYQRTAAAMSIRRDQVPSPSIVPGTDRQV